MNDTERRPRRHLSGGIHERLIAAMLLVTTAVGCDKKTEPNPTPLQKTTHVAPPATVTTAPVRDFSAEKQKALDDDIGEAVAFAKIEIAKAKEAGKTPLVVLLEDHMSRDSLAKEFGIISRLKNESGISDLTMEATKDYIDDINKLGRRSLDLIPVLPRLQDLRDGKVKPVNPLSAEEKADLPRVIEGAIRGVGTAVNVYSAAALTNVANANGMQVTHLTKPASLHDKPLEETSNQEFFENLRAIDTVLLDTLRKNVKTQMLVTGSLHGKTLADNLGDTYHIIPISLAPHVRMDEWNESKLMKASIKRELKEPLTEEDKLSLDLVDRTDYYAKTAFQASRYVGIESITEAFDRAKKNPDVKITEPATFYWRALEKLYEEQKARLKGR